MRYYFWLMRSFGTVDIKTNRNTIEGDYTYGVELFKEATYIGIRVTTRAKTFDFTLCGYAIG